MDWKLQIEKEVSRFQKINTQRLKNIFHLFLAKKFVAEWPYHTKNQPFPFCAIWMSKDSTKCAKLDILWKKDRPSEYCSFKFFINWVSFGILHYFIVSYFICTFNTFAGISNTIWIIYYLKKNRYFFWIKEVLRKPKSFNALFYFYPPFS